MLRARLLVGHSGRTNCSIVLVGLDAPTSFPCWHFFLYVGPFLYLLITFHLAQAGDLCEVPQLRRALKSSAALALILVALLLPVLISALYGLIQQDSWLILLFLIILVLAGILLVVSAQALQKGIRGVVTKICPENPPLEFRAALTVSSYATALWIFVTLVLWFLSFSSDPTVAKLFSQQYANVWAIFFLPAAAIIIVLYGRALGKLAHSINIGTPRERRSQHKT